MRRLLISAGFVLALAACGDRAHGDAPVGDVADTPWDIENAPDGYGNLATKCSVQAPGMRIWVSSRDVQPIIVRDESCA